MQHQTQLGISSSEFLISGNISVINLKQQNLTFGINSV